MSGCYEWLLTNKMVKASQFLHRLGLCYSYRRIGLMELNSRETATTRRGERGGHWMAEETRPSWSDIVYLEACAHSARAICTVSPISDAAYFTLTVKVLGLCSKSWVCIKLKCDTSLVFLLKVSGHFVGGSIVHLYIHRWIAFSYTKVVQYRLRFRMRLRPCSIVWLMIFSWKPFKTSWSIIKWNSKSLTDSGYIFYG